MYLECRCCDVSLEEWHNLMKGFRGCSYKNLVKKIEKELPQLYHTLQLHLRNPYDHQSGATRTHYVLVHSAIEYFIRRK